MPSLMYLHCGGAAGAIVKAIAYMWVKGQRGFSAVRELLSHTDVNRSVLTVLKRSSP